jgi:hypothetical protein
VKIKEWNSKIKGFFKEKFSKSTKPPEKPSADEAKSNEDQKKQEEPAGEEQQVEAPKTED